MSFANKGRGKYRFNIIDILLLVVIVLSVAAILFLFFYEGQQENGDKEINTVEIIYTVEQTQVPDILRGKIGMGDSVVEADGLTLIGQVIDVEYTDSVYSDFNNETNSSFEELYPGKIDVRIRISAKAIVDENGLYTVNDFALNVGNQYELRFPYYTGNAVCISVSEVSE